MTVRETDLLLENVAQTALKQVFKEGYQTQDNLKDALGVAIARYCDWCGKPIMEIFMFALEDANYHRQANIVQEWIDEIK